MSSNRGRFNLDGACHVSWHNTLTGAKDGGRQIREWIHDWQEETAAGDLGSFSTRCQGRQRKSIDCDEIALFSPRVKLLLDGQHRLTALWRSLSDYYEDRRYFVSLDSDTEVEGAYTIVSLSR